MAVQIEKSGTGEFLLSHTNTLSLDVATVSAGQVLAAGAVLGRVTASGEVVAWDPAGADGSETPAGVLLGAVDATDGAVPATIVSRLAEVKGALLVFDAAVLESDQEDCKADLLPALFIIAR